LSAKENVRNNVGAKKREGPGLSVIIGAIDGALIDIIFGYQLKIFMRR